jgi:cytochrome c553
MVLSLPLHAQSDKHARGLAASCAACHGTNGNSVGGTPVLAGMDRALFIKQMKDFKSGTRPATVMHQHARGYSDGEIEQLAGFFSSQHRMTK